MISPLTLEILIHYCVMGNEFRDGDLSAPAIKEGIKILQDEGILVECASRNQRYKATSKARFYLDYICKTPFPISIYKIPERVDE